MIMRRIALLFVSATLTSSGQAEVPSWLFASLKQDRRIVVYERDVDSGGLTLRTETECSAEPGVMCISPDKQTLFVSLKSTGKLASFHVDVRTGALTRLGIAEGGEDPAYLLVDHSGRYLLSAYYVANKVTVHRIQQDGSIGTEPLQTMETAERAHGIVLDSSNRMAFVPHTGSNRIFQLRFEESNGRISRSDPPFVEAQPGQEPRHIAIHPSDRWVYSNNEAGDSLSVYDVNKARATLTQVQTVSTLPPDFDGSRNSTARCEITVDGRFIYVANRGHDSIASFAIDQGTGRLTSLGQAPTEKTPRSFTISPDGQFLYAAGQGSGRVATYRIQADGSLNRLRTLDVGPIPWCVLAVDGNAKTE